MAEAEPNTCIDCGKPAGGLRCKACHGKFIAAQALAATASRDAEVLTMVDDEKLSGQRLASRLGVSRTRARTMIRNARNREARRKATAP